MFRFVYYYTIKQQIWELEAAIQRVTYWMRHQTPQAYFTHPNTDPMEQYAHDYKAREQLSFYKALLSIDKCSLRWLKMQLHGYTHTYYDHLRRRRSTNPIHD